MRLALGTTILERGRAGGGIDGIGNYTRALETEFRKDKDIGLSSYVFAGASPAGGPEAVGAFQPQALLSLTTGLPFPVFARGLAKRVDLVHATDHLIPCLPGLPVVASLMDAIPLARPEYVTYRFRAIKNALWKRSARWASHVITISEFSRGELVRWFGLPAERVSAIPLGVDEAWFGSPGDAALAKVVRQYALPERYFLFVGTLQPRKNLAALIAAHQALPRQMRGDVPLVVVGRAGWGCEQEVRALEDGDEGRIRWLKYLPDADLLLVLKQASALVFPSLYEGFGLPVLEAFAAGVPVVTSRTSCLPETAGDAAVLVDPANPGEIAEAMKTLIGDASFAQELATRGSMRARLFTWERTAAMTQDVYRRVLASS